MNLRSESRFGIRTNVAGERSPYTLLLFCLLFFWSAGVSVAQNIDQLSERIRSGNIEQKRDSLTEVRNLRSAEASRAAIPALRDKIEIVRATAASAVVFSPANEAVEVLLPLVSDKKEFVRREAIFALGEVGSDGATASLVRSLNKDGSNTVRAAAAAALGKIGDPAAVTALTAILKKRPSESDEYRRRSTARSIGQIAETVRGGPRQKATPQSFLPEEYKKIISATEPATKLFPVFNAALEQLLKTASNPLETDDTRREAAYALGAIGDSAASSFLTANLANTDVYLAEICREALLKIPKSE